MVAFYIKHVTIIKKEGSVMRKLIRDIHAAVKKLTLDIAYAVKGVAYGFKPTKRRA